MIKRSATCWIGQPVTGDDIAGAIDAARSKAAETLGGADGLRCVGINTSGEPMTAGTTWLREWEEKEAPALETKTPPARRPSPKELRDVAKQAAES